MRPPRCARVRRVDPPSPPHPHPREPSGPSLSVCPRAPGSRAPATAHGRPVSRPRGLVSDELSSQSPTAGGSPCADAAPAGSWGLPFTAPMLFTPPGSRASWVRAIRAPPAGKPAARGCPSSLSSRLALGRWASPRPQSRAAEEASAAQTAGVCGGLGASSFSAPRCLISISGLYAVGAADEQEAKLKM